MNQVFKTLRCGLVEFAVVRVVRDQKVYFQVEYRLYTYCDPEIIVREFEKALIEQLGGVVQALQRDGDHGTMTLIPVMDEPGNAETLLY